MDCLFNSLIETIRPEPVRFLSLYQHTTFLSGLNVGLCSPPKELCHFQNVQGVGTLHEKNCQELAKLIFSENSLERSIGWAAINSQYNSPKLIKNSSTINAFELLLTKGKNKNVAILGNFPWCKKIRSENNFKNLWIFELNPPDDSFFTPSDYERLLPKADIVLFTALTLINRTFNDFFPLIESSFKIMTGPSSPLVPVLHDFGIDAVCGSVVVDEEKARTYLSQGASYRHAQGLQKITLLR